MSRRTTLFVAGFDPDTRAKDLAYEFERFGRLVRCDIPAPKGPSSSPYAFVEYEEARDADEAQYQMDRRRLRIGDGESPPLTVQFARVGPSATWRHEGFSDRPPRGGYPRDDRDREPVRRPDPYRERSYRDPPPRDYRRRSPSPPPPRSARPRTRSPPPPPPPRRRSPPPSATSLTGPMRGDDDYHRRARD